MNLVIWWLAMFFLGLLSMAIVYLFMEACANLKDEVMIAMIYVTAFVAAFLFVYLVAALIRPEWF